MAKKITKKVKKVAKALSQADRIKLHNAKVRKSKSKNKKKLGYY